MKISLACVKLKTGEELEVNKVVAPDAEYSERIHQFYSHKPDIWLRDLSKRLMGIETGVDSWYIGELRDKIVTGIQLTYAKSNPRVGAIDHVFTLPDQRQKGAADAVMSTLIQDYKSSGGETLLLGTGKEGPAHHLYVKYGFIDYNHHPKLSGTHMRAVFTGESQEEFDQRYFAGEENLTSRGITRSDLALFRQLFNSPSRRLLKNYALGIQGRLPANGLLEVADSLEAKRGVAMGLEKSNGNLVGVCTLLTGGSIYQQHKGILDIYIHQNFPGYSFKLLKYTLEQTKLLKNLKIVFSFVESADLITIEALKSAGFKETGLIPKMFLDEDKGYDVAIYNLDL